MGPPAGDGKTRGTKRVMRRGMGTRGKVVALIVLVILVPFALIGFLTLTRGTPVQMVLAEGESAPPAVSDSEFARTFELFTGTHFTDGNAVEALENGNGTYPKLWDDLRNARETITMQMYYSLPGVVADSFATVLRERARAGVRVLVILDAFGSQHLVGKWTDSLQRDGVEVALLRKVHWYSVHHASERSHVRVVVIDGRVGYTGGFGIADYWLGDGRHEEQWREENVRFAGPAVLQLQAAFAAAWAESTGELLTGARYFPPDVWDAKPGTSRAGVLYTAPTTGSTPGERYLALSIVGARKRLYITNSYFVPDDDFRNMLKRAARRGVDVRVLTEGPKTDVKTTWYAGRYRYEELLRAGVRIYEYQPTMMHAKSLVADGVWASIGSANFDNRSLAFNNESNLVVLDTAFARGLESAFLEDLRYSKEIKLDTFSRRPVWKKAVEGIAASLQRLL